LMVPGSTRQPPHNPLLHEARRSRVLRAAPLSLDPRARFLVAF
jgi:hypothetical protein